MRWRRGNRSSNLEDRRAQTGGGAPGVRIGLSGVVILLILSLLFGRDLLTPFMSGTGAGPTAGDPASEAPFQSTAEEEELVDFVSFVLDDIQAGWTAAFATADVQYQEARLVLYRDAIRSACGLGQAAMGPFYCPGDQKVYVDLSFYDDLRARFGAPGDFAQAYVLAHEIGHHVQNLLGIEREIRRRQAAAPAERNQLSVQMELQADCLAGVWGYRANRAGILEAGDIEEGLRAAAAIGDDRLQRQQTGRVSPESFTHGTSEQREASLRRGLSTGDPDACDSL